MFLHSVTEWLSWHAGYQGVSRCYTRGYHTKDFFLQNHKKDLLPQKNLKKKKKTALCKNEYHFHSIGNIKQENPLEWKTAIPFICSF